MSIRPKITLEVVLTNADWFWSVFGFKIGINKVLVVSSRRNCNIKESNRSCKNDTIAINTGIIITDAS